MVVVQLLNYRFIKTLLKCYFFSFSISSRIAISLIALVFRAVKLFRHSETRLFLENRKLIISRFYVSLLQFAIFMQDIAQNTLIEKEQKEMSVKRLWASCLLKAKTVFMVCEDPIGPKPSGKLKQQSELLKTKAVRETVLSRGINTIFYTD